MAVERRSTKDDCEGMERKELYGFLGCRNVSISLMDTLECSKSVESHSRCRKYMFEY